MQGVPPSVVARWSWLIRRTTLRGSWARRAYYLLRLADIHGLDSPEWKHEYGRFYRDGLIVHLLGKAGDYDA